MKWFRRSTPLWRADIQRYRTRLADFFQVSDLREEQWQICTSALEMDVLAMLPTGHGKTIGFWCVVVLADLILNGHPGDATRLTDVSTDFIRPLLIVISPLTNLMKSQCDTFNALYGVAPSGLRATFVAEEQTDQKILDAVRTGAMAFAVLYMGPEMALSNLLKSLFTNRKALRRIPAIVVDEAQCVIHWGEDFRIKYRELYKLRSLVGKEVPWIAVSATLTPTEQVELRKHLGFHAKFKCLELPANRYHYV